MFQKSDFAIFDDPTLAARMDKIRRIIDPKFEAFAEEAQPILQADGRQWVTHVAKHKMRKVHPPKNTWVAFAPNKRGYKMEPHFELGLFDDHLYLYLAIEENMKKEKTDGPRIALALDRLADAVSALPADFVLSTDHMVNNQHAKDEYQAIVKRFGKVKAAEVLIGRQIKKDAPLLNERANELPAFLLATLKELLPLYERLAETDG
ncbi:DUF1054 domain-containing protein [Fructobacillus sp. M1-13]|uniref:UPF0637 protein G6R27_03380 n=1 Tax=Fructobacillus papyriferae TaxID=2713171 RepID=A0ABS5QPR1_9LACO|nr:DUF1054 family protein [Fructobacillus papyriferae]MBS9335081.1 DUF1054 family protein [Fructobacillus papyriferae]MCD2159433.1 DUF1054 domain-containing protein [Fructobacillus papyriferae]